MSVSKQWRRADRPCQIRFMQGSSVALRLDSQSLELSPVLSWLSLFLALSLSRLSASTTLTKDHATDTKPTWVVLGYVVGLNQAVTVTMIALVQVTARITGVTNSLQNLRR